MRQDIRLLIIFKIKKTPLGAGTPNDKIKIIVYNLCCNFLRLFLIF